MTDHYFEEEEFTTQFNGQTILRIVKLGLVHWRLFFGFLASIGTVAILEAYFTYLSKRIIDEGILAGDMQMLQVILIQYAIIAVIFAGFVFGFIYCAGRLGEQVRYDLRKAMFEQLQKLSLSYFDKTPVGWLMSRLTSDTQRVGELISWGFLDVFWGVTNIITAMAFMFYINARLALIVLLILPILVWVAVFFKRHILVEYREVRKLNSKITGAYNENVTGVRVVKSLRREEGNLQEFGELTDGMYRASYRAAWLSALFLPAIQLISALAIGSIIYYGGWQYSLGGMTIGGIQAFISYVTFMLWPIQEMARVYAEMQRAVASGERIFLLIDSVPEIQDGPAATNPGSILGDIVFDNVNFAYEPEKPVFANLNLHIKQGETIALVGPTGAGKSTLVNLVCRFYEPQSGTVRIAGHDIVNDLTQYAIQSRIGMVLQTPHLFSGTISDNLRYGRLDAMDDEIVDAAKLAGAHEFISELEDGYETEVGEGGVLLSTGQKQLISLARAVLAQPDIFIMDEATSSVDTLTEALIQRGMDVLLADRTSFVIAHRLSTIKRADRILVIADGGIAEQGSHAELIRAKGYYYNLYARQFREEREQSASVGAGVPVFA